MYRTRHLLLLWLYLLSCLAFASDLALARSQVVRVGLWDNKPMCYREGGQPAGIFVVVLESVAKQEGWQLQYVDGPWRELQEQLAAGEIDILPSMAISAERQAKYSFNHLDVFTNWGEIYTQPGARIQTFFDLQGKKVACMDKAIFTTGPEGILAISEMYGVHSDIILVPGYREALALVDAGQADAAVVNRLVGALYGPELGLHKSGIVFAPVKVRFALTKENPHTPEYVAAIDRHFQVLLDNRNSPYHEVLAQIFAEKPQGFQLPVWLSYVLAVILGVVLLLCFFVVTLRTQVARRTKALLDSEKRFLNIAENCLDWVWEFDEHERFTYASPRVKDLLGYSPEEVIGKSAFDLIPSPEKEKVAAEFQALKDSRRSFALLENVNQHKDGHLVALESSGVPIIDPDGTFRGYRGIDRDISERKTMEDKLRQAQKMEAIGTLSGGIAHDFNNILTSIFGYAELARMQITDNSDLGEYLEQILNGARRAKELVSQILAFSRHSTKAKEVVLLAKVVEDALKLLRPSLPTTIEIRPHLASSELIFADVTQIHQVVMNLCTNAYHAMEETGGVLTLQLSDTTHDQEQYVGGVKLAAGRYVVLRVSDTGKGIAKENLEKIFEPYFTTKDKVRGTGMGLAVVHGVVCSHEGAIEVDSKPGQGTCFSVYFPVFEGARADGRHEGGVRLPAGHGESVLVVDDEKEVRKVVALALGKEGYMVDSCANGQEALDALAAQKVKYDLLLTDMTMPVMTGKELALAVMERYPELPIVICTGYSSQLSATQAKDLGIQGYLEKPISREELLREVRQVLDRLQ